MPIQVAQLQITVETNAEPAIAGLTKISALYAQQAAAASQAAAAGATGTQASVAAAQAVVAANQQVITSINSVTTAVRANTLQSQRGSAETVAALNQTKVATRSLQDENTRTGVGGQRAFNLLSQGAYLAGGSMGPLTHSIGLVNAAIDLSASKGQQWQRVMVGAAAAVVAALAVGASIQGPREAAEKGLENTLDNLSINTPEFDQAIDRALTYGHSIAKSNEEVLNSLNHLLPVVDNATQLTEALAAASDVAALRNLKLRTATDAVVRAMEGYPRTLRNMGVNLEGLVQDPAKNLENALGRLSSAQDRLQEATISYNQALASQKDQMATAALRADGLAKAEQTLARAQEDRLNLMQRLAAEAAAPAISKQQKAIEDLTEAEQHLADVRAIQYAESLVPQIDKVADATDKLFLAQLRLKEIMEAKTAASTLKPEDMEKLAAASEKVLNAQMALAHAQGADIASAQHGLRAAVDAQRKALDEQAAKQREAVMNSSSLVSAQMAVKDATRDLANAQTMAALQATGSTAAQIRDANELRDAIDRVAEAHKNVGIAAQQDASDATLRQLETTKQIRDADRQVEDALLGIKQAHNDILIAQIQQHGAAVAVENAHRRVQKAQKDVATAAVDANDAMITMLTQAQKVIDAIEEVFGGEAQARSHTWWGRVHADIATAKDKLGDVSEKVFKLINPVGGPIGVYGIFKGLQWILGKTRGPGGGVAGAAEDAAEAIGGIATKTPAVVETASGTLGRLLPVIGGIGLAAGGIWNSLGDKVNRDRNVQIVEDTFHDIAGWADTGFDHVTGAAKKAWGLVSGIFSDDKPKQNIDKIAKDMAGAFEPFIGVLTGLKPKVDKSLENVGKWAKDAANNVGLGLKEGTQSSVDRHFIPYVDSLDYQTRQAAGDGQRWLNETGKDVARGLGDGLEQELAWQWANRISIDLSNLVDKMNFGLGVASPSTIFYKTGAYVVEGLVNGITDSMNKPTDAMLSIADQMSKTKFGVKFGGLGVDGGYGADLSYGGGVTIVQLNLGGISVQGSVSTEKDLVKVVGDGLISLGFGQGGNLGKGFI